MSAKKEKKIKSEKNTPAKAKLEIPDFIAYQQVNIGSEKIDAANVQQLLSERAQCKLRKDFDRADAIARSLQSMNIAYHDEKREWYVRSSKSVVLESQEDSRAKQRTKQQERNRRQAAKLRKPKRSAGADSEEEEDDLGSQKRQRV